MSTTISAPESIGSQASEGMRLRSGPMALNKAKTYNEEQLTEKANEFEQVFISQMLNHMFDSIETNEMFGGGEGEEAYKSFMLDEYSKLIVQTGGIGVADHVKAEMIRMQEVATGYNPLREAAVNP
ncbi:MAG: hypothetical protein FJX23_05945 [Alphaproteobacteria bacterium]|nr:hypothetical protein [Alphaproteobacteria bacterium]